MHPYTACWCVGGIVWSCADSVTKIESYEEVVVDECAERTLATYFHG